MAGVRRTGSVQGPFAAFGGDSTTAKSVFFNRDDFDVLVKDHGYLVTWEKAALCPNRPRGSSHPDMHDLDCTICDGRGYVYYDPKPGAEMVIQSAKLVQQFYAQGRWDIGSVIVTARPGCQISWWDRLTLENGSARFSELVTRRLDAPDPLRFAPLVVEYISWVDRDDQLAIFAPSTFSTSGHRLTWRAGQGPDVGSRYTISYCFRPRYIIQEMLHHHRESPRASRKPVTFPVQAVAKIDLQIRNMSRDVVTDRVTDPFDLTRDVG